MNYGSIWLLPDKQVFDKEADEFSLEIAEFSGYPNPGLKQQLVREI
jgi:hypothetical protein